MKKFKSVSMQVVLIIACSVVQARSDFGSSFGGSLFGSWLGSSMGTAMVSRPRETKVVHVQQAPTPSGDDAATVRKLRRDIKELTDEVEELSDELLACKKQVRTLQQENESLKRNKASMPLTKKL